MEDPTPTNVLDLMDKYESGDSMNNSEVLELFSYMIRTGMAWNLQGSYGRTARAMINNGFISVDGDILWKEEDNA